MAAADVVIAALLPPAVEAVFVDRYAAKVLPPEAVVPDRIGAAVGMARILVPAVGVRVDRALIEALPDSIRLIANFGAGTDHIDRAAAAARGIMVSNTPDVLTAATADI